jgi:L-threonine kinase
MARISNDEYYEGVSYAHFGELLQGWLPSNTPFLVSCPITVRCICRIFKHIFVKNQNLEIKKAQFLELFNTLSHTTITNQIKFKSVIPRGVGLGSSTCDLVALFNALNLMAGNQYSNEMCEQILSKIEPSDSALYPGLLVFNHYTAEPICFIKNIIPDMVIVGVFDDKIVDTIQYNRTVYYSKREQEHYANLLKDFIYSCEHGDEELFGSITTTSFMMNQKRNPNRYAKQLKQLVDDKIVYGLIGSHSGSCAGVYISLQDHELKNKIEYIKNYLIKQGLKPLMFRTHFGMNV